MLDSPIVIFGCGYVGGFVARAALAAGIRVRACARNVSRLQPLAELGAEIKTVDASKPKQFGPALSGMGSPVVVYAIPPPPGFPAGEAVRRATSAAILGGARSFVYLGSTGVYGMRASDEEVDEDSNIDLTDGSMSARIADESALQGAAAGGLHTATLRLAAIYGPGRGVRERLRLGTYKLTGDGENWFSRIHVLDLVEIIFAAAERAPVGSLYCVADDHPARQREYATWLAAHLGIEPPVATGSAASHPTLHRGRRVKNDRMKRELGIALKYPSFVEGELQIDAAEKHASPPIATPSE